MLLGNIRSYSEGCAEFLVRHMPHVIFFHTFWHHSDLADFFDLVSIVKQAFERRGAKVASSDVSAADF
jgi:hypothetical protein